MINNKMLGKGEPAGCAAKSSRPSNEDFEKIIISTLGLCDNLRKYTFVENIF